MQMTAEMMVQAMQDKVHLPLQVLLKNDAQDEIYYVRVPEGENLTDWWTLHTHFKEKFDYLTFAMQTKDKEVLINPSVDHPLSPGDGIWLIAPKRPVHIKWPA